MEWDFMNPCPIQIGTMFALPVLKYVFSISELNESLLTGDVPLVQRQIIVIPSTEGKRGRCDSGMVLGS
jgi:hypothetical protein